MEDFGQSSEIVEAVAFAEEDFGQSPEGERPRGGGERRYSIEAIYELLDAREAVYDGIRR